MHRCLEAADSQARGAQHTDGTDLTVGVPLAVGRQ